MKTIGCVGSRELTPSQLDMCYEIGFYIGKKGYSLASGNALGADGTFAHGANKYDPSKVTLYTPWAGHNTHFIREGNKVITLDPASAVYEIDAARAEEAHPYWHNINRPYIRSLFIRNAAIVGNSDFLIACPSPKKWSGTRHSMKIAENIRVPVFDISSNKFTVKQIFEAVDAIPARK